MIHAHANPKALDDSQNSIFFKKPDRISINESGKTQYASSQKIETLIKELKEKGPLVALGKMGPKCYEELPFKLNNPFCNLDVYGWKPGSQRISATNSYAVVLGAKKLEDREYVYFTMSEDITSNQLSDIREHKPLGSDTKIYVVSHKTFRDFLNDLYPPSEVQGQQKTFFISSGPKKSPDLSKSEAEFAKKLCQITPLKSILDRGIGEKGCKAIGQEIFDKYKKDSNNNSFAGKEAAQRICNAVKFLATDGSLRKDYIERAWNGIGDDHWRWQA